MAETTLILTILGMALVTYLPRLLPLQNLATCAMPPLRLLTSTVFHGTDPGYFTSRIARPKLVTYGPSGSGMISEGRAAPSSVARAHTKL